MRILLLAALVGSGLCAQTPAVHRRFFSPSTPMIVTPNSKGGRVWPGIIPYVSGHLTPARGRACAIPLINVAPRGGFTGDPKIMILGSRTLANVDHMPLVQGVPVCTQGEPGPTR